MLRSLVAVLAVMVCCLGNPALIDPQPIHSGTQDHDVLRTIRP